MKYLKKIIVLAGFIALSIGANAGSFDDFFESAQEDDESKIIALTLRGFDLNTLSPSGDGALYLALREGSLKVADFLISQPKVNVELRNTKDESPLMMAALKGHLAQAKKLIQRKAEVNKTGWTPLHYAATNPELSSLDMTRLLLEHFAYIDAASPNKTTPLMMAAHYGQADTVKLLLEEGADPGLRNALGLAAIDFARRAARPEVAELIAGYVRARKAVKR